MKKIALFIIILTCNIITAQKNDRDYYTLVKNGEKYLKPIKYVLFSNEKDEKIISNNSKEVIFNIGKQSFKYIKNIDKIDTCSILALQKIKISSIKQLFEEEYKEHQRKLKLEKVKFPPPPNHYNLKIFMIEKIINNKFIKYEVDWIYSIP